MKHIKISFLTYLFYLLLILSGYIKYLIFYFIIIIIHELGHIIFIKLLGYKIEKITILPCGGIISTNININIKSNHLFLISIGGILNQLLLFLIIKNPILIKMNLFIIIFNLLPIYPLDGYKIVLSFIERITFYKIVIIISYILSFIFLFIFFYLTKNIIMFILLYLLNISYILIHRYYFNKFYLERYLYPQKYNKIYKTNSLKKIYKNKQNIINNLNELEYFKKLFSYF